MARKVIAGILFLASTSTNVFADDCCRQQMVTGLNVFFWATKLKYFAQQIRRICRLPLFGRSVHAAWGKAFQWFGSTGPRHMPGGEIQPKISFNKKMQEWMCVRTVRLAQPGGILFRRYLLLLFLQAFCSKTVFLSTECWFCRELYCCSILQVTLFGSSPQWTAVPGEIGLAIAISPKF